jgi:imidazolonepropionase-like amidohydrolase
MTMAGPVIEGATIQIAGPNIRQIGKDVEIPDDATVIDGQGMTATPGLIDADATLAVSFAERGGDPSPSNKAFDAFDRYATSLFKDAVRNGVTTLAISPRTGMGITGTAAVVRLQPFGDLPAAGVVIKDDAALCVDMGSGARATQRLETLDRVRRQFKAAIDYRDAAETYKEDLEEYEKKIKERAEKEAKKPEGEKKPGTGGGAPPEGPAPKAEPPKEGAGTPGDAKPGEDEIKKPTEPSPDRNSEVLLKALNREMPVRFRCERSADILNALDLAKEFSLDAIIDGGAEAYLVAPQLAKADAKVVLGPSLGRDYYSNDVYQRRSVAGFDALRRAGVECAVGTGRGGGIEGAGQGLGEPSASRFVLANAELVAQQSDGKVDPLKLVTADAAKFLGVSDKVGRLRPGLAADIVLWTGDPLDPASHVREVYVGGELVYRNEEAGAEGAKR